MKRRDIGLIFAPLFSTFIIMNGLGLFTTFMPLRLSAQGISGWGIGFITAAYYLGMAIGAFQNASLILRVGHIRTFAALVSIITAIILLNSIFTDLWTWIAFRFIVGYCLAGLYIVIESWILKVSSPTMRGTSLALYMIALYSAGATGQFLLNFGGIEGSLPFIIVSILSALSIVPLTITKIGSPVIEEPSALNLFELFRLSHSGFIACTCAGMIFSTVIGFHPLYLQAEVADLSSVSFLMFMVLLGGTFLQYPVGKLSDYHDRRLVLVLLCLTSILTISFILFFTPKSFSILGILMFLFGGLTFSIYPVSMSHTCDYLDEKDVLGATQGLVLAFGIGAVIGPLIVPVFMKYLGHQGILSFIALICTLLGAYLAKRVYINEGPAGEDQQEFVAIPSTTPIAGELDPRAEETT